MEDVRPPGRGRLSPFTSFQRNARLMVLAVFLDGVAISFIQLFFNFFILARGYGVGFLGLANSMSAAAGLALGFPLGRLADRVGFRNSMLLGVMVGYSAFCVVLFTPSPGILLAGMALQGAGSTLFYLSVNPFLMKHSGLRERPLLFSTSVGLQILAGAAGSLIAGQLPAGLMAVWSIEPESAQSYQAVLLAGMLCGSLALIPLLLARPVSTAQAPPPPEAKTKAAPWTPGEKRMLAKMVAPNLIIATGAALLIPYLNLFLRQRFSVSDPLLGAIFSFSAVFTGLAAFLSPWLAARLGSKIRAVIVSQSGSLLFLLVLGFVPFFPVAGVAFVLRAGLMNMSTPLYSAFCMENTAEGKHGTVSSLIQMAWQAGWTIGPFLSGFVQGRWGFAPLFLATGLLYVTAVFWIGKSFLSLEKESAVEGSVGSRAA